MTRLVVPGVDPADQRTSWEVLHARLAAYYRAREEAECHTRRLGEPCVCTDAKHGSALNAAGGA